MSTPHCIFEGVLFDLEKILLICLIFVFPSPALAQEEFETRSWEPDLGIDMDGLKTVVDIYAEHAKLPGGPPNPVKYVDLSYLHQAWKELGWNSSN